MDIAKKVANLERTWGTTDPFKLCEFLKIHVKYSNLGEIKGLYKKVLRQKFIIINEELSSFDKKVVCAHELGHCLLHDSKNLQFLLNHTRIPKYSYFEKEANEFAARLIYDETLEEEGMNESKIRSEILREIEEYF